MKKYLLLVLLVLGCSNNVQNREVCKYNIERWAKNMNIVITGSNCHEESSCCYCDVSSSDKIIPVMCDQKNSCWVQEIYYHHDN